MVGRAYLLTNSRDPFSSDFNEKFSFIAQKISHLDKKFFAKYTGGMNANSAIPSLQADSKKKKDFLCGTFILDSSLFLDHAMSAS